MLGLAYLQEKELARDGALVDRILKRGESAEAHLMLGMAKRGGRTSPAASRNWPRR